MLDNIRSLVQPNPEDERRFETVARLSEVNQVLYASFVRPTVRAAATTATAEALRTLHPDRLQFSSFSDRNPFMAAIGPLADTVRQNLRPVASDNPFVALEHVMSEGIQFALKSWGKARDTFVEQFFLAAYGSPAMQAVVGLAADHAMAPRHAERDLMREAAARATHAEFEAAIDRGSAVDAFVRAAMYIALPAGRVDERGFAALQQVRSMLPPQEQPRFAEFKEIIRRQFLILRHDEERAIEALRKLAASEGDRGRVLEGLRRLMSARPTLSADQERRLERVKALLETAAPRRSQGSRAVEAAEG